MYSNNSKRKWTWTSWVDGSESYGSKTVPIIKFTLWYYGDGIPWREIANFNNCGNENRHVHIRPTPTSDELVYYDTLINSCIKEAILVVESAVIKAWGSKNK